MIARVEKPYSKEEYKAMSTEEKRDAKEQLINAYILKYEEVKQPHLLRTARRLLRSLLYQSAGEYGIGISKGLKHYEKGDYWRYCEAMAGPARTLCKVISSMCVISREHGYYFNPYCIDIRRFIDMFVQYCIPTSSEVYGDIDSDSEKPDVQTGEFGTLFDEVESK